MPSADDFLDAPDTQAQAAPSPVSASGFLDADDAEPSTTKDVVKSLASGVGEGAVSAPYWLGDLGNLANKGVQKGYEYYRDISGNPMSGAQEQKIEGSQPFYSSGDILKPAEDMTGIHPYQPQTTAGQIANIVGGLGGFGSVASPGTTSAIAKKLGDIVNRGEQASRGLPGTFMSDVSSGAPPPPNPAPSKMPPNLQNIPSKAWSRTNDILQQALQEEGIKPENIADNLEEANKTGLPISAIDVATKNVGGVQVQGKNILGLADAAANMPGQGAAMAGELASRGYTAKKRIGDLFDNAISNSNIYDIKDDALAKMASDAPPAYEQAYSHAPVYNDRIAGFLQEPEVQAGIKRGLQIQRLEARANDTPFNPMDYSITGFTDAGDPIIGKVPNMRLLDAGKKGLDAMVRDNQNPMTGKLNELGGALQQVKKSYVGTLDDINPDYANARSTYGDQASRLQALNSGRNFMNMDKEEIQKFMQDPETADADRASFLAGARRSLQDKMSQVGDNANAATQLWKENIRDRLQPMFDNQDEFNNFSNQMQHEQNMVRTNSALTRQSATMPRQQYADMINQQANNPSKILGMFTRPMGSAAEAGMNMMSKAMQKSAKGMTSDTAAGIMHYLTSNDPNLWRELATKNSGGTPSPLVRRTTFGGLTAAAGMGSGKTPPVSDAQAAPLKIDIGSDPNIGPDGLPRVNLPSMPPQSQASVPPSFQQAEGMPPGVYKDKNGNRTVGVGFNMDNPTAPNIWHQAGMTKDFNAVRAGQQQLSPDEANKLLGTSYNVAQNDIKSLVPNIGKLGANQQEALTHLAFQYGKPHLKASLPGVLGAANAGNPKAAAARLLASDYARQFPVRAKALARSLFYNQPVNIGG